MDPDNTGDLNCSPVSMRKLSNANLSPQSISGAYELDRTFSQSQAIISISEVSLGLKNFFVPLPDFLTRFISLRGYV